MQDRQDTKRQGYFLGETPNGKVIEAYMQEERALYRIRFTSGGELPVLLSGEYTQVGAAQKDVDFYLSTLTKTKATKAA
jgi:hypothetical protein